MSHTEQILDRFTNKQGWDRNTQLELALRYIEDQQSPDGWEDFLTGIAETENAEDMTTEDKSTTTIQLDSRTQRFYQGAAVGSQVLDAHADADFPDEQARLALFYFYAGALAVADHKCSTNEDFEGFLLGLATRAPQPKDEDED